MKRNANGSMRSDGDGEDQPGYCESLATCETPLPLFEYDTATINTLTTVASTMGMQTKTDAYFVLHAIFMRMCVSCSFVMFLRIFVHLLSVSFFASEFHN